MNQEMVTGLIPRARTAGFLRKLEAEVGEAAPHDLYMNKIASRLLLLANQCFHDAG